MARPDYCGSVVYFIGAERGPIKIGVAKDVHARLRNLQTGSGLRLTLLAATPGSFALERHYHQMFADMRDHGEWFRRHPALTAEIRRLKKLSLPAYESAAARSERERAAAEAERLRAEWSDAMARRNRSAGGAS